MTELPEAVNIQIGIIPKILLMSWLTIALVLVLSLFATRRLSIVPRKLQAVLEMGLEFVYGLVDSVAGSEGKRYYPLFVGLFLYIFVGNLLGLVPGLTAPTSNLNMTASLAIVVFISTHYFGIRRQGLVGYLKHMTGEVPWWLKPFMFVIEIISNLARPLSLSFRLFGNMMAKEVLLGVLAMLVVLFLPSKSLMQRALTAGPFLVLPFIYLLGMLISFIQAFIFTILAIFYIGSAIEVHDEVEDHGRRQ
ncbi:MAG TPA: F0F1 ATP synthase subunit A [bacterium]|nr:F0F1 ATP synthase subunit A [bacterium]